MTFRVQLAIVTVVGAAWRLGYLWFAKTGQELLLNDSLYYSVQAGLNSEGSWFKDALSGQPGAEHGMFTSLYLTPWSLGAGDNVFRQRLGMSVVGIATVAIVGSAGRSLIASVHCCSIRTAERVGLVAAAIAAVYPNLWINDSLVMSESLALLLVSASMLVALRFHAHPTVRSATVLGVLAGLGALTRSELALLIPGFALLTVTLRGQGKRSVWAAAAILAASVATLLPWTLYNAAAREPVLLSTNDGNTLLGANCDRTYYDDVGGWDIVCLGTLQPGRVGHEPGAPDASERSRFRRAKAFEYMEDHLDRLPVVMLARLGRAVDLYGLGTLVHFDVGEEKARWAVWTGIACWYVLAVLAVLGWRELRRQAVSARWWLLVPVVAVLITTLLFYGSHRIRAPAEPAVVLLAAVAVAARFPARNDHRRQ